MRLIDYYNDMNDGQKVEFCEQAFIPKDVSLEIGTLKNFMKNEKKF